MLLEAGADVNAEPAAIHGRTALDGAAEHGRFGYGATAPRCGSKE